MITTSKLDVLAQSILEMIDEDFPVYDATEHAQVIEQLLRCAVIQMMQVEDSNQKIIEVITAHIEARIADWRQEVIDDLQDLKNRTPNSGVN